MNSYRHHEQRVYSTISYVHKQNLMNRDTTIIQIAVLLIVIAIIGLVIADRPSSDSDKNIEPTPVIEWIQWQSWSVDGSQDDLTALPQLIENSERSRLVKRYFQAIANEDYTLACTLLSTGKCAESRPGAVANFSREFSKFERGYEFVDIMDWWITAPSGKNVVCVKYQYTLIDDANPDPVSEILSYYVQEENGSLRITDRVCEKKYKEWRWVRDCPIEPNARFCVERF